MCAIIGSFDLGLLRELVKLNSGRGQFSFSLTHIEVPTYLTHTYKDFGEFYFQDHRGKHKGDLYYLCHIQSPTSGQDERFDRIHPALHEEYKLYHNGILKQIEIKRLNGILKSNYDWDTQLMMEYILDKPQFMVNRLSAVDGQFACALLRESMWLKVFRNPSGILYADKNLNISSLHFEGAEKIDENWIYNLDLVNRKLIKEERFYNKNSPYYFGGTNDGKKE